MRSYYGEERRIPRWLPIKITRGHRFSMRGYEMVAQRGKIQWTAHGNHWTHDTSGVKFQVWIAGWLYFIPSLPEHVWRHILNRLWYSRLEFQYEAGYAAGLKEGARHAETMNSLTPEERAAITEA